MNGMYVRKFAPNKLHITAAILFLMSLIMLIVGIFRFSRATGAMSTEDLRYTTPHRNDSILFPPEVLELTRKGSENRTPVCFMNEGGRNVYVTVLYYKNNYITRSDGSLELVERGDSPDYICFAAVKEGSAEERDLLEYGGTMRGYFSDKYTGEMKEYLSKIDKYYETKGTELDGADLEKLPELGVIIINTDKEELSFLWALPFLIAGLIVLKKAGSPYFYFPEEETTTSE